MNFKEYLESCLELVEINIDKTSIFSGTQYVQGKKAEIEKIRFCLDIFEVWEAYQTNKNESLEVKENGL